MLVPEDILARLDAQLRQLMASSDLALAVKPDDEFYAQALSRALLFAKWPYLLADEWHILNGLTILYNYYFWHSMFAKLYMLKHGFIPEIEETTIRILGTATCPLDWSVIEEIDQLVEEEVAKWVENHR